MGNDHFSFADTRNTFFYSSILCWHSRPHLSVCDKKISVEYEFDEYGKRRIQLMDQAMGMLINNRSIWQVNTIQANSSRKTNAGASESVGRKLVKFQKKKPFFLKTDATCYHIKLLRDNVFILPDRLIIKGKKGWGAVDYGREFCTK